MSTNTNDLGAPPPYTEATPSNPPSHSNNLQVPQPKARNGISPEERRSMEDEGREMPEGWVRTYDPETHHQFFVNTTTDPPRSIWHHPYDDPQFLSTVSSSERSRIQGLHKVPTAADIEAESSDDDDQHASPQNHAGQEAPTGVHKFGRKMKDKLTSSTHVQREQKRRQREEEERQIYERHQMYRRAMSKAAQTGEPQCIGRDRSGKEVYIEPPMGLGAGFGGGRGYSGNAYGYNPYTQGGYAHPNSRYIRPQGPYRRPYGGGYGGGYGMGLGMPLMLGGGLGLGGAMMLGGMGGGFGGGMDGGMGGGFGGGGMDGGGGGGMC